MTHPSFPALPVCALALLVACCGCVDPSMFKQENATASSDESAAPPQQNARPAPAQPRNGPQARPQPQGFSETEWKLVDRNLALEENPDLVEVENRIDATDPLMAATQSYFTLGSRAHLLAFKHNINIYKAQHEKNPTFAEFNTMMRQAQVELKGLYPWQVYAYDEKAGEISILEDRAEKRRLHEERGLPVPD